ncbi:Hypothetical protein LUCI_2287 [Lucifera butyrica]|uniref:Uncharacterized protein n=1 Tax=Lucifera butyrica TaxID=1351585 RepID=A0A498RA90_9FIRM|nr:hypothetical protein [Lucifera butyrica]VBB07043.1 Hypothetical protein LUCI_2287 [Lucifera butyrica]
MTIRILSDSETARRTYPKEVGEFLENGLPAAGIPQESSDIWLKSPVNPDPAENPR